MKSNTINQCKEIFTAKRHSDKISKHRAYASESYTEWNLIAAGTETITENIDIEFSVDLPLTDHTEYRKRMREQVWLYLAHGTDELKIYSDG